MNIDTFLKYSRPIASWICPHCEIENDISGSVCSLCNAPRPADAQIVKMYEDMPAPPVVPNHFQPAQVQPVNYSGTPLYKPPVSDGAEQNNTGLYIAIIAGAVFFAIIITIICSSI